MPAKFGLNPLLQPPLNDGLKPPLKFGFPFPAKLPSLFHSELLSQLFSNPPLNPPLKLFEKLLFQPLLNPFSKPKPLNGVLFQFHAPGNELPQFEPKLPPNCGPKLEFDPLKLFHPEFHPENGVFQLFHPWKPLNGVFHPEFQLLVGKLLDGKLAPNPDQGVELLFQFVAPGNEPNCDPNGVPKLLFQFDGPPKPEPKPGLKPEPKPVGKTVPGKFDANGVLNMCFSFSDAE